MKNIWVDTSATENLDLLVPIPLPPDPPPTGNPGLHSSVASNSEEAAEPSDGVPFIACPTRPLGDAARRYSVLNPFF
jgi:hypothetical protein